MEAKPADPLHRLIAPKRLVVRESTDAFLCEDPMVSAAVRFISHNIRRTLSVQAVAGHLGVSRHTLKRRFDLVLQRPIHSEIKRLRIDYIKRLLLETDLLMTDIPLSCGFGSTSSFAKYFRSETGVSPGEYRRPRSEPAGR